jgi:hypothetical protein
MVVKRADRLCERGANISPSTGAHSRSLLLVRSLRLAALLCPRGSSCAWASHSRPRMVRRGSTVRVRQRALKSPQSGVLFPVLMEPSTSLLRRCFSDRAGAESLKEPLEQAACGRQQPGRSLLGLYVGIVPGINLLEALPSLATRLVARPRPARACSRERVATLTPVALARPCVHRARNTPRRLYWSARSKSASTRLE